jgi:hypothetical protein
MEMISPCVQALRHITNMMKGALGIDIGSRHPPADLSNDLAALMKSLNENKVYREAEGRVLDDDDQCAVEAVSFGLRAVSEGTKNSLTEYNRLFRQLQRRCRITPVVGADTNNVSSAETQTRNENDVLSESEPMQVVGDDDDAASTVDDDDDMAELFDDEGEEEETLGRINREDVAYDMDNDEAMGIEEELEEEFELYGDDEADGAV